MNLFDLPRTFTGGAFNTRLISHFRRENLLMIRSNLLLRIGLTLLPLAVTASMASAATEFSHTLRTFTGDSTQGATQTAVSAAGFNFFENVAASKVDFNSTGAIFGDFVVDTADDVDRNYMRTNDDDYANVSFVAEITFVTAALNPPGCTPPACGIDVQDSYFGLGAGNANLNFFHVPDYQTDNASVHYWGENEIATPTLETYALNNGNTIERGVLDPAPGLVDGTHRVRLTYDWFRKTAQFAVDLNYAGGINDPFVADLTAPVLDVLSLYGADGFHTEPGRIYFGGDERVTFKDFEVDVLSSETIMGDFNSSNTVTEADWAILRANMHSNLSSLTHQQAYFLGDLTADKANNHDDFVAFKTIYEDLNGSGSFTRMVSGIPEPTTFLLFLIGGAAFLGVRRRADAS
jgi:hypothetical protein